MRLSVDEDDPGFSPLFRGVRVHLDGIERTRVVTADEEQRLIVRYFTDERGLMRLNKAGDGAERETLTGDVRIEVPDDHPSRRYGWLRPGEKPKHADGGPVRPGAAYLV